MILRFVKLDDIKDLVIKVSDATFKTMRDTPNTFWFPNGAGTFVAMTNSTWLNQKAFLWDYHFDVMRTHQYSEDWPEADRPKRFKIRLQRNEYFYEVGPTTFLWRDPYGNTQNGTYEYVQTGTWESGYITRTAVYAFNGGGTIGVYPNIRFYGAQPYGASITGITDMQPDGFVYWVGVRWDTGATIRGGRILSGLFVQPSAGADSTFYSGASPVSDNTVPPYSTQSHVDYNVTEKFIANYRSLCSSNVISALDSPANLNFREVDARTQIISAIKYGDPRDAWLASHHVVYIVDGLDTVFLAGEVAAADIEYTRLANDLRLKQVTEGEQSTLVVRAKANPFGFNVDGHFFQLGSSYQKRTGTRTLNQPNAASLQTVSLGYEF